MCTVAGGSGETIPPLHIFLGERFKLNGGSAVLQMGGLMEIAMGGLNLYGAVWC